MRISLGAALGLSLAAATASAQTAPPPVNSGAVKLTTGLDVPSVYYFRGIRQEVDPKATFWPYADIGFTLASADAGLKSVSMNIGTWNSLHTGSSGTDISGKGLHYEEDFYTSFTLGFAPAAFTTKYIAYTSPNGSYKAVHELDVQVTGTQKYAPYGLVAFELSKAGADGGTGKGSYLELGAAPNWPVGKATFAIPISVGISMKDYYQDLVTGDDTKFGFFDIGGMITVPLGEAGKFGSWNFHARADYLNLGDGTAQFVDGAKKNQGVVLVGLGMSY